MSNTAPTSLPPVNGHGLVLPDRPTTDVASTRVAYGRYLGACCHRFLDTPEIFPAALRPIHARVAELVRAQLAVDARLGLSPFATPAVTTPLLCATLGGEPGPFRERIDAATRKVLPQILLELVCNGLMPADATVAWDADVPELASPVLGSRIVPPQAAVALEFASGRIVARGSDGEVGRISISADGDIDVTGFALEQAYWSCGDVTMLSLVDHNPLAAFETHPEKSGNHVDLGDHDIDDWLATLDAGFALVQQFLPREFQEMGMLLREIVPVGYHDQRHLSASYREAVGTVYMTLHPNLMTMTEAIIHEFQHNKLNVSAYSTDYLHNAFFPLYKSPVRPDPRPLWGILLAVHAFLPVAELYRRMIVGGHPWAVSPEFLERLSQIDEKNHEGMAMLRSNAEFTTAGRNLFDDLTALEEQHLADRRERGLPSLGVGPSEA